MTTSDKSHRASEELTKEAIVPAVLPKRAHLPALPSLLVEPGVPLIHRDNSWLQFNHRVLAEARSASLNPLMERLKFLGISSANLDEFFMIRVSSLLRKIRKERTDRLAQIGAAILESVAEFSPERQEALDSLIAELSDHNIEIIRSVEDNPSAHEAAEKIFLSQIVAHLPAPEAYRFQTLAALENLQMLLIIEEKHTLVIPRSLPLIFSRFDKKLDKLTCFFLDDLLKTFCPPYFGLSGTVATVRLTRDSDFSFEIGTADPESIPDMMRGRLNDRDRGAPVRLQYRGHLSDTFLNDCMEKLKLASAQLFPVTTSLCLSGLWKLQGAFPEAKLSDKALFYPPIASRTPKPFRTTSSIFERLDKEDYLLHHPYDSFEAFLNWLRAAVADRDVERIEQTIYRTDDGSPIIAILKEAAKTKEVCVAIELRARFDELNNLKLADELKKAGVKVAFGFGSLKLHAKVALVTRRVGSEYRRYAHLSTGNYNSSTARLYTDLSLITSNGEIGEDVREFFDSIYQKKIPTNFRRLVSAPTRLHRRLLTHIADEISAAKAGAKTRIVAKVNALVDETVIAALYEASAAGVQVDLIVRGACSLLPGVRGLSERIRVFSLVDRFLEHSRIYYFQSQKAMYLSSADWMPRNFFSRLELAFPVMDPKIFSFIESVLLPIYLADNQKAQELTQQGTWKKVTRRAKARTLRAQFAFEDLSLANYKDTPLNR